MEEVVKQPAQKKMMERYGRLEDLDRSFDLEFWQAQSASARIAAACELAVTAHLLKGLDANLLRLQRHIESFQRV